MSQHPLADSMYRLHAEVRKFDIFPGYTCREYLAFTEPELYARAYDSFERTNAILEEGGDVQGQPQYALTRRMLGNRCSC